MSPPQVRRSLLQPLVEQSRVQLRGATADANRIVATSQTALSIAVTSASIARAIAIVQAVIQAWEEAGGSVTPGVKSFSGEHKTGFAIGPDQVLATLIERTEPIPDWKPTKNSYQRRVNSSRSLTRQSG